MKARTWRAGVVALAILAAACGSSATKANPCATPGATYLFQFVEQSGGTCGSLSDAIVNVNPDGTIVGSLTCKATNQNGCTAQNTGCTSSSNGTSCTVDTDVTFASDGSGATGLETFSCANGASSCTSTYAVTATRQ
jgi:hypothetical protein